MPGRSGLSVDVAGDRLSEGCSVFVRADGDELNQKPFIAKIKHIEPDEENGGFLCTVNWFYRPEDPGIPGGRKPFHGERELYESDHRDVIHSATILGRCVVHKLEEYNKLDIIRPQDYFARWRFILASKSFWPQDTNVYCVCRMPENPDRTMCQCDMCQEWFHPDCCGTTLERVEALAHWHCPPCERQRAQQVTASHASPAMPASSWLLSNVSSSSPAGAAPMAMAPAAAVAAALAPLVPPPAAAAMPAPAPALDSRQASLASGGVLLQGGVLTVDDPLLEALHAQIMHHHHQLQQQQGQQQQQHSVFGASRW